MPQMRHRRHRRLGRPAEALQYVSAEDKVPPHCFDEYAETLDRVYEALGRTDVVQPALFALQVGLDLFPLFGEFEVG